MIGGVPCLEAIDVTCRFGGLVAVDRMSLKLMTSSIHALIGTNGAGKSTLINLLSGDISLSAGQVTLSGEAVSDWSQPKRAQRGLGRTFQRSTIFPSFTTLENCRLSAQSRTQRPWDWLTPAKRCKNSVEGANRALEMVGLLAVAQMPAATLSHGQRRQLEIAMCLATEPKVLLLDEPLAGMGADETERMLTLFEKLRSDRAILLVEHDMDAVFRIADQITVMVNGVGIASGTPHQIRSNLQVQAAYLGSGSEEP
jgi:branched-chain amino acid transport system ATP-binding protein